jgi:hypothetical protein
MTLFRSTESFEIPVIRQRLGGRKVDVKNLKNFWQMTAVAQQRGCHVFSICASKGEKL